MPKATDILDFFYWIFDALKEVFKQDIQQDPTVALLVVIPKCLNGRDKKYLLNILLTAALKCLTIRWLKPDSPTHKIWLQKVWELYQMEHIIYSLRLQKSTFTKQWSPIIALLMQ